MRDSKTGSSATFYNQQVLRRHVESNRIAIIWQMHIEPLEFQGRRVSDIQFLEKGHVLIKPHNRETATDSEDEPSARVSTCYVIIPHLGESKQRNDPEVAALTELVVNTMSANISISIEMIENMLVDEAIRTHNAGFY